MDFVIRQAEHGQEEQVLAMYEWLFAPPGIRPGRWEPGAAKARLIEAIDSPSSAVFIVQEGPSLIAFCTAYLDLESVRFGKRCWVEDLAVDPGQRSRGVGAALLQAAKDWAAEAGATHLELDSGLTRATAHRFYEREGGARQSYTFGWEL